VQLSPNTKIFIAGHRGMVGAAIVRKLKAQGYNNLVTRTHSQLDLTQQTAVREFLVKEKPEHIVLAAAKVGGIHANNTYPAEFIYQNLMIECNVIHQAYQAGISRLLFLGSSCIYPKFAEQPMSEESLLSGKLEPTNEPYAIAKIAGIKLCESYNRQYQTDYRSVMPTNLYGPNDNFDLNNSHVIPALIRKFHEAKINNQATLELWGSGNAKREFLHVDDMADASFHVMMLAEKAYQQHTQVMLSHINVGSGYDISIKQLAAIIQKTTNYNGSIIWNTDKPDGPPRKLMNVDRLRRLGWQASIPLETGIHKSYQWFLENYAAIKAKETIN
jgi:GDP-L-fucose synthase